MLCSSCGLEVPPDSKFCNGCWAKLNPRSNENSPSPSDSATSSISSAFVGRQREIGLLKAALEDALSGHGRLVMLTGEPGIGKTRTSQELALYAETLGIHIFWGRCYEGEGSPPYWPWIKPLHSYIQQHSPEQLRAEMGPGAADIAEIVPEAREKLPNLELSPTLEPEQARFRLFTSITTFLTRSARSRPMMLVLEDLHWADRSSLLLMEFLAQEIQSSPLLVLGTYRDVEISRRHPLSETLGSLMREQGFLRVQLSGLAQREIEHLIERTAAVSPSPDLTATIHQRTEGNPLFVTEIIRMLPSEWIVDGHDITTIPEGVRDAIGRRLNRLSEDCNQVLFTASVVGREFDFRLLSSLMVDLTDASLLGLIDEALGAHVIEEMPEGRERYQFSHALVQETLSEELSTSRRVRMHARIGEALEGLYGEEVEAHASELAYHFAEAETLLGTEKVVQYSLLAGEQALAVYDFDEGLGHFQRGLAAKDGQPVDAESAALMYGLGRAQLATLDRLNMQEAFTSLSLAFDYYVESGDASSALAVAQHLERRHMQEAFTNVGAAQLLARALALAPRDSSAAGHLLSQYGTHLAIGEGDYPGAQKAFERALEIAQREGDVALEMRILSNAASVDYVYLNYSEGLEKSLKAIESAQLIDDPHAAIIAHHVASQALSRMGKLQRARQHAAGQLALAERLRDRSWLSTALWINAALALQAGDWDEARGYIDRGLAVSSQYIALLLNRSLLEYEVGDTSEGERYVHRLTEVLDLHSLEPGSGRAALSLLIAMISRIEGVSTRLDMAERVAESVVSASAAARRGVMHARAALAFLAVHQGNVARAEEQYIALSSVKGTILIAHLAVDRLLGLLAQTMGTLDQATVHFEDALVFCRKAGYRPELAWTCSDFAGALLQRRNSGDQEKAKSLLDEASAISQELGMIPLMERVVGLRERSDSQPVPGPTYPDGLTQREVEVLSLVAAGRSNRDIAEELVISPRTVVHHMTSILNKTNAANRTEAALYASQHGLVSLTKE